MQQNASRLQRRIILNTISEMAKATAKPSAEELDPLAEALGPSNIEKFIEQHKLLIVAGLAAFIILVAVGIWIQGTTEARHNKAAEAFSAARSVDDYNQVIEEFPKSVVAGNALLRKAALLDQDDKPDQARAALTEMQDRFPRHPRHAQATVFLARLAIEDADSDKARELYQSVPNDSELAPFAQMRLGDLALNSGEPVRAKSIYQPVNRNYENNAWASQLAKRIERADSLIAAEENPSRPAPIALPAISNDADTELEPKIAPSRPTPIAPEQNSVVAPE